MTPSKLTIDLWPATTTGRERDVNEDFVLVYQPPDPNVARFSGSLYIVTDGIGGEERGQKASRYAAEKVMHAYYTSNEPDLGLRLRDAISEANLDLFQYARQQPELVKMGAAIVAAVVRGEQLVVASVGDSRAYLIKDEKIEQITRDHTLVQQLLDEQAITPEEAQEHPRRDVVLRMLGSDETVVVDVFDRRLSPDDVFLLCSDGLTGILHTDELAMLSSTSSPRNAAETIVQKAGDRGSKDNVTVITGLIRDGGPPLETALPHTWSGEMPALNEASSTLIRSRDEILDAAMQAAFPLTDTPTGSAPTRIAGSNEPEPGDFNPDLTVRAEPLSRDELVTPPQPGHAPTQQGEVPPYQPPPPAAPTEVRQAPPYQNPVQPAPNYGDQEQPPVQPPPVQQPPIQQPSQQPYPPQQQAYPPAQQPYPPQQQAYPPQQEGAYPQEQPGLRGVPQGYAPPPNYVVDPVTGLPPSPQDQGQGGLPGQQAPRIYQPPGAPNTVGPKRRGISVMGFAGVAIIAFLLTTIMVIIFVNPLGWNLDFLGGDSDTASGQPSEGDNTAADAAPTEDTSAAAGPTAIPATPVPAATATPKPTAPPGMVEVIGGAFTRGVTLDEIEGFIGPCIEESQESGDTRCFRDYFQDATPIEQITLNPFYIDITEVTNLNYAQCVASEVCSPPENQEFYADTNFAQHPVVYVTWTQANEYCSWAGKRLPTEAEWEKAARWDEAAQVSYVFPWGDGWEVDRANTAHTALGGTTAVGAFAQDASPSGVLGMAGNVSEWVFDWYFGDYSGLGTLNPIRDGNQPLSTPERGVRGASYSEDLTIYVRSGHRLSTEFDKSASWLGFRCASDIAGAPAEAPTEAPVEDAPVEGDTPTEETPVEGDAAPTEETPAEGETP